MSERPALPVVTNQALAERLEGVKAVLAERIDGQASQLNDRLDRVRLELSESNSANLANTSDMTKAMKVLEKQENDRDLRERERNGHIANLMRRMSDHDDWHGKEDEAIRDRIGALEGEEHDAQVKAGVWKGQIKAAMGGAGFASVILGICRALGLL